MYNIFKYTIYNVLYIYLYNNSYMINILYSPDLNMWCVGNVD